MSAVMYYSTNESYYALSVLITNGYSCFGIILSSIVNASVYSSFRVL